MRTRLLVAVSATAVLLLAFATIASASDAATNQDLAAARRATAAYHNVERAVADGYRPASPCVPHMGFHYVRSIAASGEELNPTVPNILVYAPQPNGTLRLVAVEYASWSPASLFDQALDPPGQNGPPFYTLHAWIWQANPDGIFAAHNPNITCET